MIDLYLEYEECRVSTTECIILCPDLADRPLPYIDDALIMNLTINMSSIMVLWSPGPGHSMLKIPTGNCIGPGNMVT